MKLLFDENLLRQFVPAPDAPVVRGDFGPRCHLIGRRSAWVTALIGYWKVPPPGRIAPKPQLRQVFPLVTPDWGRQTRLGLGFGISAWPESYTDDTAAVDSLNLRGRSY